jgi:hypothetical protein
MQKELNVVAVIKSRRKGWAAYVEGTAVDKCPQFLVVKPKGKKPHGRHRLRWEDNIKMYLHGVEMWGHRLDRPGSG